MGIARQDRLCTKCNLGEVGDEFYLYAVTQSLRDKFMTKIIYFSKQFSVLSNNDKLVYTFMLRTHDNDILPIVCEWIKTINEVYS